MCHLCVGVFRREGSVIGAVNGSSGGSSGQQALPVLLSQHHGLVSALSASHAAYGPTVRLAKRWLGANLLLGGQVGRCDTHTTYNRPQ